MLIGVERMAMYTFVALVYGLVLFGIPGLVIATASAHLWARWMRGTRARLNT